MTEQHSKSGQYYLLEKVAQGGMAEIYKGLAYDLAGIKRTVCIKKILSHIAASREFIDMLVDEAKIAVKLNHGNIAQIYDLGKAGDDYFIVMEYVEGQTLSKLNKKGLRKGEKIPLALACYILAEVAGGLNYMHTRTDEEGEALNIIHRDISPQNIMVSYSGTVKIIDFGIAKAAMKVGHTDSGILKGKFAYMSPEQARGDQLDHRSDIFSLGIIFHEILTGKRLFKGTSNKETLKNVKRIKIPPPSDFDPDIPPELDAILLKALARDRRHRYAFASDLQEELMRFLHIRYANFRPAILAEYIRHLFREELELHRKLEMEEAPTPHLILEKTASSREEASEITSQKGENIDWKEFMLEEDWPEEKTGERGEEESSEKAGIAKIEEDEEEDEERERTPRKWINVVTFKKQVLAFGTLFLFVLGAGYAGWHFWGKHRAATPAPALQPPLPQNKPAADTKPATAPKAEKFAVLVIDSNPPGAKIYFDDADSGRVTPATFQNIKGGQAKTFGLYLENYKFHRQTVVPNEGETHNFFINLEIDYGSLKVGSYPPGAVVLLNGGNVGNTPWQMEKLEPGKIVQIDLLMKGYRPFHREVKIKAGKEILIHSPLEKEEILAPK